MSPFANLPMGGIHRQRKEPCDLPRYVEKLSGKNSGAYTYRRIQKYLDDPKLRPAGYVSAATKSSRTKAFRRCTLCGKSTHKAPPHRYFFNSVNARPDEEKCLPKEIIADVRKYQKMKATSILAEGRKCTRISAGRQAQSGRYARSGGDYLGNAGAGGTCCRKLREGGSISTVDLCLLGGPQLWSKFRPEMRCAACGKGVAEFGTQRCGSASCRKRVSWNVVAPISTAGDRQLCRQLLVVRSFALARPVSQRHVDSGFDPRVISQYYQLLTKKLRAGEKRSQANVMWTPPPPPITGAPTGLGSWRPTKPWSEKEWRRCRVTRA